MKKISDEVQNRNNRKKPSWPVSVEVLEAKDVKQADGQVGWFGVAGQLLVDDTVDFLNNPYEQLIVDRLREQKPSRVTF